MVKQIDWYQKWIETIASDGRSGSSGPMEDFELMQSSGFKDSGGVEVYEGDIVLIAQDVNKKFGNEPYFKYGTKAEIMWDSTFGEWVAYNFEYEHGEVIGNLVRCGDWNFLKILGNIYQNPELLGSND